MKTSGEITSTNPAWGKLPTDLAEWPSGCKKRLLFGFHIGPMYAQSCIAVACSCDVSTACVKELKVLGF